MANSSGETLEAPNLAPCWAKIACWLILGYSTCSSCLATIQSHQDVDGHTAAVGHEADMKTNLSFRARLSCRTWSEDPRSY